MLAAAGARHGARSAARRARGPARAGQRLRRRSRWRSPGQLPLAAAARSCRSAKLVATALTIGSGGAGGLFTPVALLRRPGRRRLRLLRARAVARSRPRPTAPTPRSGMAAIAAGTSHAPISAILILFEFTGNYELILPLMVASIISSSCSRSASTVLDLHRAAAAARRRRSRCAWRRPCSPASRCATWRARTPRCCAPATPTRRWSSASSPRAGSACSWSTSDGRLAGRRCRCTTSSTRSRTPSAWRRCVAHDLMVPVRDVTLAPSERLHRAAETFAQSDFERLPVVERRAAASSACSRRRDLLAVYAQEVLGRPALLATFVSAATARLRATTSSCRPTSRCAWCRCRATLVRPDPRRGAPAADASASASSRSSGRARAAPSG